MAHLNSPADQMSIVVARLLTAHGRWRECHDATGAAINRSSFTEARERSIIADNQDVSRARMTVCRFTTAALSDERMLTHAGIGGSRFRRADACSGRDGGVAR